MDKAIAHTKRLCKEPTMTVHTKWCGATAIIFIPLSKLRSLTLEDNFNNTFNKNAFPFVHSTMVKHCKCNKGVLFNQVICRKNFLISVVGISNADCEYISFVIVEWRQNLNRDYKKISPQKMSPSHSLETQTIISL